MKKTYWYFAQYDFTEKNGGNSDNKIATFPLDTELTRATNVAPILEYLRKVHGVDNINLKNWSLLHVEPGVSAVVARAKV